MFKLYKKVTFSKSFSEILVSFPPAALPFVFLQKVKALHHQTPAGSAGSASLFLLYWPSRLQDIRLGPNDGLLPIKSVEDGPQCLLSPQFTTAGPFF